MTDAIKKELDLLVEIILKTVKAEAIYLFGSYARGDARADSDLNLYVVLEDGEERPLVCVEKIHTALWDCTDLEVNIMACYDHEFQDETEQTLWEITAREEGVKIYEKPRPSMAMA